MSIKNPIFKLSKDLFSAEPISLKSLCRHTIRQKLGKDLAGQQAKIQELNLPITIKDFLKFKDRDH